MMKPFTSSVYLATLVLFAVVAACGSDDGDPDVLRCDDEDRAQLYVPGMVAEGIAAVYSVRLVESTPGPPSKGDNSWILEVLDYGSSAPVVDATISVFPFMPDHGHGTPVNAVITPTGDPGQFEVTPINLWMPGFWEVIVDVDVGDVNDEAVFGVCIEG